MPYPLLVLALLLAASEGVAVRARTEVIASAGKVTVRAERIPVNQVLDRLAQATGMKLTYEGTRPQALVSIDVENVTEVAAVIRLMEGLGISYVLQTDETGERVASLIVPGAGGGGARVATNAAPAPPEPEEIFPAYDHIPLDPAVLEAQGGERKPDLNNPYMGLPVQHFPQAMTGPPEPSAEAPQLPQPASFPSR